MLMDKFLASPKITPLSVLGMFLILLFTQGIPNIIEAVNGKTTENVQMEVEELHKELRAANVTLTAINKSMAISTEIQRQQFDLIKDQKDLLVEYKFLLQDISKEIERSKNP